jgi:hypothetical protein
VVSIYEAGECKGTPYIAIAWVEGEQPSRVRASALRCNASASAER